MKIFVIIGEIGDTYNGDYEWWTVAACSSKEHAENYLNDLHEEEIYCLQEAIKTDKAGFFHPIVPRNYYDPHQCVRFTGETEVTIHYSYQEIDLTDIKMALLQD